MEKVGRRPLVTLAFALMVTVQVLGGQLVEGDGVAPIVLGGVFALGVVLGLLAWPFLEDAARMGPRTPRERVRANAIRFGTVAAALLIGQTLVAGSIDRGDVVRVGVVVGVLFAFVALLPWLAGAGRWQPGGGAVVVPRSAPGPERA